MATFQSSCVLTHNVHHTRKVSKRLLPSVLSTVEFGVSKHVLDIVYSQTICWMTVFFAPLILVVTVLKTLAIYIVRMFYVRVVRQVICFFISAYNEFTECVQ